MFLRFECEAHLKLGHPALVSKPDPTTRPKIGPKTGPRTGPVLGVKQIASHSSKYTMGPFWGPLLSVEYWTLCLVFSSTFTAKKNVFSIHLRAEYHAAQQKTGIWHVAALPHPPCPRLGLKFFGRHFLSAWQASK